MCFAIRLLVKLLNLWETDKVILMSNWTLARGHWNMPYRSIGGLHAHMSRFDSRTSGFCMVGTLT